jgi:hypothetical protein
MKRLRVDRNRDRVALAAVNNGGNQTLATKATRRILSAVAAAFGIQDDFFSHIKNSWITRFLSVGPPLLDGCALS